MKTTTEKGKAVKISVVSHLDPQMFPALLNLAQSLKAKGAQVEFISSYSEITAHNPAENVNWVKVPKPVGWKSKTVPFRTSLDFVIGRQIKTKPDWIICQNDHTVPSLLYKLIINRNAFVTTYFTEYQSERPYIRICKFFSDLIDAYVDVCGERLQWRKRDWPRLRAAPFIIRQAPFRRKMDSVEPHIRNARLVFTGSSYVLGLDRKRLSGFLNALCKREISVDWYLPGTEETRASARSLLSHPRFTVRDPIEKSKMMEELGRYDIGLHWAPMVEIDYDPEYFLSAASNKIGEYIAAGLIVAHAGNPGLSYIPESVCCVFDPTDPDIGASQVASQLSSRSAIEDKRRAAFQYHLDEMNFEAQALPFLKFVMEQRVRQTAADA